MIDTDDRIPAAFIFPNGSIHLLGKRYEGHDALWVEPLCFPDVVPLRSLRPSTASLLSRRLCRGCVSIWQRERYARRQLTLPLMRKPQ